MEDQNNEQELQKLILEFNKNPENQKLIDYYTSKSFFEILSKPRSETVHSSFLAWILEGKDFSTGDLDSPVMGLLDILSEKSLEAEIPNAGAGEYKFPKDLLQRVLSRSATITVDSVKLEECLPGINEKDKNKKENRFDITLRCTVNNYEETDANNKLLIVIENKIGSKESSKKNDNNKIWQTQRYFNSIINTDEGKEQYQEHYKIFVFLTPPNAEGPKCQNFVHITYQDIMDRILDPLANSSKLGDKAKVLIQDYIKTLSVPAFTEDDTEKKTKKYSVLAVGAEEQNKLTAFEERARSLITQIDKNQENDISKKFKENYEQLFIATAAVLNSCKVTLETISILNKLFGKKSASRTYTVTITDNSVQTIYYLCRMDTVRLIIKKLWAHYNWDFDKTKKASKNLFKKDTKTDAIKQKYDGNAVYEEITMDDKKIYVYTQWRPENFHDTYNFDNDKLHIQIKPYDQQEK